jgi:hypothetical protein
MKDWSKKNWVYLLAGLLVLLLCRSCHAQGVVGMEKTIKLPEDGTKWHISVIGTDERYKELVQWFEAGVLKDLRSQVHFHPISDKTGIQAYQAKGLPTVRLQDDKGRVLYEAAGDRIPATAYGLYGAMARAIQPCPWDEPDGQDPDPVDPVSDGGGKPTVPWYMILSVDWRWLIVVAAVIAGIVLRRGSK